MKHALANAWLYSWVALGVLAICIRGVSAALEFACSLS